MSSLPASWLFPISTYECGFTTKQSNSNLERIAHVALSDKSLGVHKSSARLLHKLVKPPAPCSSLDNDTPPCQAWEAFFPKGSINPSATIPGGFGFYLSGPSEFADRLESATEAMFSYKLMLQEDWEWVKGGKLPGM